MFEPAIVWHYYGRLRDALLDAACPELMPIVRSADGPRVVLIPTTSKEAIEHLARHQKRGTYRQCRAGDATALRYFLQVTTEPVFWLPPADAKNLVDECQVLARAVGQDDGACVVLPPPGLTASEALRLTDEAPSRLLDGSHPWEQRLPQQLADLPEPIGSLLSGAWRDLLNTTDTSLLSRTSFEERLAQLHPAVSEVPLWYNVIDAWRNILRGMDESQWTAEKWTSLITSRRHGVVTMDDIMEVTRFESSIFSAHALKDPACLSYATAVHGSRWLTQRLVLTSWLGPSGMTSTDDCGSMFGG